MLLQSWRMRLKQDADGQELIVNVAMMTADYRILTSYMERKHGCRLMYKMGVWLVGKTPGESSIVLRKLGVILPSPTGMGKVSGISGVYR